MGRGGSAEAQSEDKDHFKGGGGVEPNHLDSQSAHALYMCLGILQGPSKPSPIPSPNRFAPIAPVFFFPLMGTFDRPVATLDLLGQDSLLLGSLLHTLGTIMYCATHTPLAPAMATALLDFLWALRYHSEGYVVSLRESYCTPRR